MELTALDIRHFELYFRYGISKTDLAGGYDAVKAQVEKDFPGHTFEEMLEQANRAFEKRKADVKPAKTKDKTMSQYHVGCGIAGIYAGTHNKNGEMTSKSLVTDEAMKAAAQYLLGNELSFSFNYGGKRYRMSVSPVEPEGQKLDG